MEIPEPVKPNPKIADFKEEMSQLCMNLATAAREIGRTKPAWGPDVTARVNAALDDSVENVAKLPDELAFGILQVSGAHVHTIGRLLLDPFASPATIAPLARSAVEYAALLVFLNREEDPKVRTVRNARALRLGMKKDKLHRQKVSEEMYADLNKVVTRYTRKHTIPDLRYEELGINRMVNQTLGKLIGPEFYDTLSSYTHHNPWKAFNQILVPTRNPDALEIESLLFAYRSSLALSGASFTLLRYRDPVAVRGWQEKLNLEAEHLLQLGEQIDVFLSTD